MSETGEEGQPAQAPVKGRKKPDREETSRTDRIFIRLSVLNTILAVAGVFTGAVALYAALAESDAVRRQSAAAVWPFVQFSTSDYVNEEGPYFAMLLENAGVGPAKVAAVRVELNGEAMTTWAEVAEGLTGGEGAPYGTSFALNRVLRPGDRITMVQTRDPDLYEAFLTSVADPESNFTYCYCSIFDDCWVADSRKDIQRPEPVDQCPDFGDEAFLN